jgi:hypothetical protein
MIAYSQNMLNTGVHVRTTKKSALEYLPPSSTRVISAVSVALVEEVGVNGGRLSDEDTYALGHRSYIHESDAAALVEVTLEVTDTSVLFDVNEACLITRVDAATTLAVGDVVISICGLRVEGATGVRSTLRAVTDSEALVGGRISVVVWRPPPNWIPPQPRRAAPRAAPARVRQTQVVATDDDDDGSEDDDDGSEDDDDGSEVDDEIVVSVEFADSDPIEYQTENPKKAHCKSYTNYEAYKSARTVAEFLSLGGTRAELTWDFKRGFVTRLPRALPDDATPP